MVSVSFASRAVRAGLAVVALAIAAGCSSSRTLPALPPDPQGLPDRVELTSMPFFRGNAFQSGPGALATMLAHQNIGTTPGLLEKNLQLPDAQAQLEQNLQQVARQYGFVVYPLSDQLYDLKAQVAAGYPVLLRFSEGTAFWKESRYAVLVGYDRYRDGVLLQAGMNRRLLMKFDSFVSAWASAGHWAVLVQGPRQLPANVDRARWQQAAHALAGEGQEEAAGEALRTLGR